jgi:hypothetical protein
VCTVEIASLLPADSPRLDGEDAEHVRRLIETDTELPPILVHRRTMRVIDGMHRLRAATLKGHGRIAVKFFDGSWEESFLRAVEENTAHGLPLSLADRKAAATRIIGTHPQLSNRAIAIRTGLAAKTVAVIRRTCDGEAQDTRIGADGRRRPLNAAEGRRRAAEVISARPDAPLREIARDAGVSLGTAYDVRMRLRDGQDRLPARQRAMPDHDRREEPIPARPAQTPPSKGCSAILQGLMRDPSLRHTDPGRELLRWLRSRAITTDDWSALVDAVPTHRTYAVAEIARQCAEAWGEFSEMLAHLERAADHGLPTNGS